MLQIEVTIRQLHMVICCLYQFSRTNHLYFMKAFEFFSLKIIRRHPTPWNEWENKATRNVYKPNKIKIRKHCKITAILKTQCSCYMWWQLKDFLQCFTNIYKLSKPGSVNWIILLVTLVLYQLIFEGISSHRPRLLKMELHMVNSCALFFPLQTHASRIWWKVLNELFLISMFH